MRPFHPLRVAALTCALAAAASAQDVLTVVQQVDLDDLGQPAKAMGRWGSITADGNHVIFSSFADDLVPGDTNKAEDIFLRDLNTGLVTRLSVASDGSEVTQSACRPGISGNGRFAVFECVDDCLVPGDTNGESDVFVRDTWSDEIQRVSLGAVAIEADGLCCEGAISQDGRWVAFASEATNLDGGIAPGSRHIYLRDLIHQRTKRVSGEGWLAMPTICETPSIAAHGYRVAFAARNMVATVGVPPGSSQIYYWNQWDGGIELISTDDNMRPANADCIAPKLSDDGRFVIFESRADNLVDGDTNGLSDIFLRDLFRGETHRVSRSTLGDEPNGDCFGASVSSNGRYVVFNSKATNLAAPIYTGDSGVFVSDLKTGVVQQLSVNSFGIGANGTSLALGERAISGDGRFVVFDSFATNLTKAQPAPGSSVFAFDRRLAGVELEVLADTIGQRLVVQGRGITPGGLMLLGITTHGQGPTPSPLGLVDLTLPVTWFLAVGDGEYHADVHLPLYWGLYGQVLYMQAVDIDTMRHSNARAVPAM